MQWNANGLLRHKNELEFLLIEKNIDVCLISETHFVKDSYLKLKNYDIYHTVHPSNNSRGGSAVIVKSSIEHWLENKIGVQEFQATTVTIIVDKSPLSITSVYSPPRHNIKSKQYEELINAHKHKFMMGGDFNAKNIQWGSRLTTPKGKELYRALQHTGCAVISTGKPTYWPTDISKIPDVIDFFVTRKIERTKLIIEEGHELSSDHSPIYLTYSSQPNVKQSCAVLTNKYTDWDYFKHLITNSVKHSPINSKEDIEEEVDVFTKIIQLAAWNSTPKVIIPQGATAYPQYILNKIKEKRKLRKKWQITRSPRDKRRLNCATKNLSRLTKKHNNQTFHNYLANLNPTIYSNYSLWKAAKNKHRPTQQKVAILNHNGQWAKSDIEKANTFAHVLRSTFSNPSPIITNNNNNSYRDTSFEPFEKITIKEVWNAVQQLKNKKSGGFDLIKGDVLKQLPYHGFVRLTTIMNAVLTHKYIPTCWKVAEIVMVQKPGKNPHDPKSYRPISLLPVIGKLFEKLFCKRLESIVSTRHIIPNHQFGFRKKHSTIEQVHRVTDTIEKAFENKKVCSAVFLDISQAFDGVWHNGLINKLRMLLPENYSDILTSYLRDRYYRVRYENEYSELHPILSGVPQGSILGPILYLIYTYDMPLNENCFIGTFADDTVLMSSGSSSKESITCLQSALNNISNWTKEWGLKLNSNKSVHVDFSKVHTRNTPLYLNSEQIPVANSAKYLGFTLDSKLTWKDHINKKRDELDIKYRNLSWLIGRNSVLSTDNKLLIYKQTLKPLWQYGIQLWGCASNSNIEKIQRFQNKAMRSAVNAPWFVRNSDLHRDLKMKTVKEEISNHAQKHAMRLQQHTNPEALKLLDYSNQFRRLQRFKPHDLLTRFTG